MILFKDIQQGKTYQSDTGKTTFEVLYKDENILLVKCHESYTTYTAEMHTKFYWVEVKPKKKFYCFTYRQNANDIQLWAYSIKSIAETNHSMHKDRVSPMFEIELELP